MPGEIYVQLSNVQTHVANLRKDISQILNQIIATAEAGGNRNPEIQNALSTALEQFATGCSREQHLEEEIANRKRCCQEGREMERIVRAARDLRRDWNNWCEDPNPELPEGMIQQVDDLLTSVLGED